MNAIASPVAAYPTLAGTPYGGGFYVGRFFVLGALYGLVGAPRLVGEHEPAIWAKSTKDVIGAKSYFDGRANTLAMAKAGSELAKWALALRIADRDDWYLPSRDEKELVYRHLKPGTEPNYQWRAGDNPSSTPTGYPYTATDPAQTSAADFQHGGAEAFAREWYWTSTQYAPYSVYAWAQGFGDGYQNGYRKSLEFRARAVRRFIIS